MRTLVLTSVAFLSSLAGLASAKSPAPKATFAPKTAKAAAPKAAKAAAKAAPTKAVAKSSTSSKNKKTVASAKKKAPVRPSTPQQPSQDRYTEIQQALVAHGYLDMADGTWGATSVAALKKFQDDQGLGGGGKLTALSLTALGLGPRRGAFVVAPQVISSVSTVTAVE